MEQDTSPIATGSQEDSLEEPSAADASTTGSGGGSPSGSSSGSAPSGPPHPWWRRITERLNVYLLLLVFVILIALAVIIGAYLANKRTTTTSGNSKDLSSSALEKLANSSSNVGSSDQVLTVQSSTIFAGKVLAKQDVEVAGNLQIGGTLSLNSLAVNGTTQLGQAQINKDLSVGGNSSLQGTVNIAKSLQVSGGGNFGGSLSTPQLSTGSLQLTGDLTLTHHFVTGGPTPGHGNGSALGSGGTSSVSGNDISGTITINTGSGPAAGCFATVTFSKAYATTPRVLVTPVGSAAAGLNYYINRSTSSFSVCAGATPPASVSFGFDYFVAD